MTVVWPRTGSCVVYWAQNAHRGVDNEALNAAIALGDDLGVGVVVYVAVHTGLPHATERSYSFLIDGLRDMAGSLRYRGIRLVARIEKPEIGVPRFIHEIDAAALVTDRSALQFGRALRALVTDRVEIPCFEVDSEHVVPLHIPAVRSRTPGHCGSILKSVWISGSGPGMIRFRRCVMRARMVSTWRGLSVDC